MSNKKIEISNLQTELTGLQALIQIIDKKLGFILIAYSVFTGFYANHILIKKSLLDSDINIILNIIIILLLVYGFFRIYLTIFPKVYLNKKPLLFFGYIASLTLEYYTQKMMAITETAFKKEIIEQKHTVSLILNNKIKNIKEAINALVALVLVIIFFIFINYDSIVNGHLLK